MYADVNNKGEEIQQVNETSCAFLDINVTVRAYDPNASSSDQVVVSILFYGAISVLVCMCCVCCVSYRRKVRQLRKQFSELQ
jgi:hypothetical protein